MHSNGVTHGSINSRNVLVSKDSVKILPLPSPTLEHIKINNCSAPELVLCRENCDYKIDIFATGWWFYEMMKNKPLFDDLRPSEHLDQIHKIWGTPKQSVIEKITKGYLEESKYEFEEYKFGGISELLSHVSQEFQDMILWLLTYDPDLRPSAATTLKHPFFNEI
jgi:serine/threonine protein kinase